VVVSDYVMESSNASSKHLSLSSTDLPSLRDEICKPFIEVSVSLDRVRTPTLVVLWRQDNTGLAIWSEMHDVAEKIEVGVLKFEKVTRTSDKNVDGFWQTEESFSTALFAEQNSLTKLVISESGYICESGFVVRSTTGEEITVVADAFPCHVAVLGIDELKSASKPEYELASYERLAW
jgi:hypothetical protein